MDGKAPADGHMSVAEASQWPPQSSRGLPRRTSLFARGPGASAWGPAGCTKGLLNEIPVAEVSIVLSTLYLETCLIFMKSFPGISFFKIQRRKRGFSNSRVR